MDLQKINGDRAIAWGAIESGIGVVTGYPGSPGTGTFNALTETMGHCGHQTEWCLNERIALDIAAGVSKGGKRALVCIKSVGMNVALDTLMVLNMTGVHAGLVILMGDDPGAWGSQNEQDTRPLGPLSEIPMVEPATPEEGRQMVRWAFDFSEALRTVVIIRITRSFSVSQENVIPLSIPKKLSTLPLDREPFRWISHPGTTVTNHRRLHQNIQQATQQFSNLSFNRLEGNGPQGIIASGIIYAKLKDALVGTETSNISILKLSTLYPLPHDLIDRFLKTCQKILVLEEVEPYLEDAIKSIGYDSGSTPMILGKRTGHVNWEGELFRWQIQDALDDYLPEFIPEKRYKKSQWEKEKPFRKAYCAGCPYLEILSAFREEASDLGQNLLVTGDPGCVVMAAKHLDIKLCMGSAIGVASGLQKSGVEDRTVAVFGDSAFYHSGIISLIHAQATRTNLLMIVLDNGGALTTGGQATPDKGLSLPDGIGPVISIKDLANTCGVESIWTIENEDTEDEIRTTFRKALVKRNGLHMVIVRKICKDV